MRKADGTAEVKIRMAEEEAPYDVVVGSSECCTFTPGGKFQLEDHEISSEQGKYVITSILHTATNTSYWNQCQGPITATLSPTSPTPSRTAPPGSPPSPSSRVRRRPWSSASPAR